MSNNLDAPNIEYVQLIKWIGHYRTNYYYKSLYTCLHYCNVAVGQCGETPIKCNIILNIIITVVDHNIHT